LERQIISDRDWDIYYAHATGGSKVLSSEQDGIEVEDKIFPEDFFHQGPVAISFKNCLFEKKFTFLELNPLTDVHFVDCTFLQDAGFSKIKSEKDINFLNCNFKGILTFLNLEIPGLVLNIKYAKWILFDDKSIINTIQIGGRDKNAIGQLTLNANIIRKRFEINHADVRDFYISYCTLESELIIANCGLAKCYLIILETMVF
jgi:hypothetical protein